MIVVAGTHRSGSSYVAQLLHASGVSLGPDDGFLPADQWNPRGYFEQAAIIDLNSRILTGFRRTHGRVEAMCCQTRYALLPKADGVARRARLYASDIEEAGHRFHGCLIKDPRFSITYPYWTAIAPIAGVVVVMRHPEASARSMRRRDPISHRMAYRFWDYHVSHLLRWLNPAETLFVDYDALAGPGAGDQLSRLHSYFGLAIPLDEFAANARALFSSDLRHWSSDSTSDLPASTHALWTQLRALADAGSSRTTALRRPDTVG